MAKCKRCGRRGLFLRVHSVTGLCAQCEEEDRIDAALADKKKLLNDAIAEAKSQAQEQLEREYAQLQERFEVKKHEVEMLEEVHRKLAPDMARVDKLKPLAKSIEYACDKWINDDKPEETASYVQSLGIENLLPDRDLQCMTMKDLRAKYNSLRKQIVTLCGKNEKRYTVKTNAAMYKLMVLALEAEMDTILYKLQFGKKETAVKAVNEMCEKYYAIASEGNQTIAPSLKKFIGQIESLYLDTVDVEYEYYVQRERAKEEQRAIKEQMRQEAEERKQLEREQKKVEAEEQKYKLELERIKQEMESAAAQEMEALRKRLEEVNGLLEKVEDKKAEIINLQNGKAGTIYIISNIGSFGDDVFKIGMTRRLEPQDRVDELGSASVPFPFDVHSFIFSEDAPALENALHKELNARRLNKVNLRKEFFKVSVDELQQIVERIDPTAPFRVTALAEQYKQSQSITEIPDNIEYLDFEDEEETA